MTTNPITAKATHISTPRNMVYPIKPPTRKAQMPWIMSKIGKYMPHQGAQECARRVRQMEKQDV